MLNERQIQEEAVIQQLRTLNLEIQMEQTLRKDTERCFDAKGAGPERREGFG